MNPPILEHFCSLFEQIAQVGLILQMGSHFAQNATPNPCSLLSHHTSLSGIYMYTKHPQPHPKTPFFLARLNFKVGKMNYCLGKTDPNWANV